MKKILFPTDFSETSKNAFIYALQLAKNIGAEVITLHVYSLPTVDYIDVPAYLVEIYDTVELSNFENYKDEIPALRTIAEENGLGDIKISNILMDGDLVSTILRLVKDDHIDYVVMGTKGATGLHETFLGTSTGNVMTKTNACVLAIPTKSKYEPIQRIVFTTRFREKDLPALRRVLTIAEGFKAHVDCIYIKTSRSDVKDVVIADWKHLFKDLDITFHIMESDDIEGTILKFISENNSQLLALHSHKRGFFEGLFNHSLTQKLAFHVQIPLMALHDEQ
ncbi:MAG TPA: universal stress protein [Flavobacterium sp.]|jgi:nucleotide-binding universal stress UspA family protein